MLGCAPTPKVASPMVVTTEEAEANELTIDWQPFGEELIKASHALNKPVLVYISYKKCKFCNMMNENTFSHNVIIDVINKRFIACKLDVENPIAKQFYLEDMLIPKIVFIQQDAEGQLILAESVGYLNPFEMINTIEAADKFIKEQLSESNQTSDGEHKGLLSE